MVSVMMFISYYKENVKSGFKDGEKKEQDPF